MSKLFDLKVFAVALVASMLLSTLLVFNISSKAANTGSTQTTNASCVAQNINHYSSGDQVWLRGSNYSSNASLTWSITQVNNPAGCKLQGNQIASGTVTPVAGAF